MGIFSFSSLKHTHLNRQRKLQLATHSQRQEQNRTQHTHTTRAKSHILSALFLSFLFSGRHLNQTLRCVNDFITHCVSSDLRLPLADQVSGTLILIDKLCKRHSPFRTSKSQTFYSSTSIPLSSLVFHGLMVCFLFYFICAIRDFFSRTHTLLQLVSLIDFALCCFISRRSYSSFSSLFLIPLAFAL